MLFDVKYKIRTIELNNEVWFIAKDICNILNTDTRHISAIISKDFISYTTIKVKDIKNRIIPQNMIIINQLGCINLITVSRKLSTKQKNELLNELNLNTVAIGCQEAEFLQSVKDVLMQANINIEIQKQVLSYRIDLYLPEYNLAIEFDEKHHNFYYKQDVKREKEIKSLLNCTFIRLPATNTIFENIGLIFKYIKK